MLYNGRVCEQHGRAVCRCLAAEQSAYGLQQVGGSSWGNGNSLCPLRLMAVPKPIGGAVVFGSNEIIYLNQAVPPCGIAINSCHDAYTKFPLKVCLYSLHLFARFDFAGHETSVPDIGLLRDRMGWRWEDIRWNPGRQTLRHSLGIGLGKQRQVHRLQIHLWYVQDFFLCQFRGTLFC